MLVICVAIVDRKTVRSFHSLVLHFSLGTRTLLVLLIINKVMHSYEDSGTTSTAAVLLYIRRLRQQAVVMLLLLYMKHCNAAAVCDNTQ